MLFPDQSRMFFEASPFSVAAAVFRLVCVSAARVRGVTFSCCAASLTAAFYFPSSDANTSSGIPLPLECARYSSSLLIGMNAAFAPGRSKVRTVALSV